MKKTKSYKPTNIPFPIQITNAKYLQVSGIRSALFDDKC